MAEFPVNDEDIKALRLKVLRALAASTYPKEAIGPIAANNGLTVDDLKALVGPYGYPDKPEMARHVIELSGGDPASRPATPQQIVARRAEPTNPPTPAQSPTPAVAAQPPALTIGTLLVAAEASQKARTRRLAAKIREQLEELRGLVGAETVEREAAEKAEAEKRKLQAEVKQLEVQLAAKRALLAGKQPRKPKPAAAATPAPEGSPKEIRAWAAANGVECPAMGRIPATVVTAYEAAKGAA